jgi:hypothetical protein
MQSVHSTLKKVVCREPKALVAASAVEQKLECELNL